MSTKPETSETKKPMKASISCEVTLADSIICTAARDEDSLEVSCQHMEAGQLPYTNSTRFLFADGIGAPISANIHPDNSNTIIVEGKEGYDGEERAIRCSRENNLEEWNCKNKKGETQDIDGNPDDAIWLAARHGIKAAEILEMQAAKLAH